MKKKGFTLIELMVAVAILVMIFLALYDLYISSFKLYKNDQNRAKVDIEVKNFSDSLYGYLKSSYQDSIEVASTSDLGSISEANLTSPKDSIFMAVYQNSDPAIYNLKGDIVKEVQPAVGYLHRGVLPKVLSGKNFEESNHLYGNSCTLLTDCKYKNKNYHYVMFTLKGDKAGEKYIETISNISKGQDNEPVGYTNMPGTKTKALEGIVEGFKITPTYSEVLIGLDTKKVLSKVSITIDYSYGKGKIDTMTQDYTIRN
ncbi:MAG: prepilin-type N-terminal cleavage/methylation domain-containing protein [Clostridium sp.]